MKQGINAIWRLRAVWAFVIWMVGLEWSRADSSTSNLRVSVSGQFPTLTFNSITNGQVKLTLAGEPGIPYFIETSSNMMNWMPVATNSDNSSNRLITVAPSGDALFYRAWRNPIPLFSYALAVRTNINLNGFGTVTDSWNSHDPNQSLNGYYNGYSGTNGSIANINGLIDIGNKVVNGSVYLGAEAFFVGSSGQVTGQIYTGANISFPDVSLPTEDTNEVPVAWYSAPGNSSSHTFTNSGYYIVSDSGALTVKPGIRVILDIKPVSYSPFGITIQGGTTNAGTIIMYQESGSLTLSGTSAGGAINNRPENFIYLGLSGVTSITMSSSSLFVGGIYAPSASGAFNGGGSSYSFIGSCILGSAIVNSHYSFHYDESLPAFGPWR